MFGACPLRAGGRWAGIRSAWPAAAAGPQGSGCSGLRVRSGNPLGPLPQRQCRPAAALRIPHAEPPFALSEFALAAPPPAPHMYLCTV
ncbi:MAG: hypothetical protein N2110_09555 [Flavobacteriales bacterium]|nr:hypothetical protein [Flavobacteriales bacterium]